MRAAPYCGSPPFEGDQAAVEWLQKLKGQDFGTEGCEKIVGYIMRRATTLAEPGAAPNRGGNWRFPGSPFHRPPRQALYHWTV